jgi:polyhydroxybutyrate depolymerase
MKPRGRLTIASVAGMLVVGLAGVATTVEEAPRHGGARYRPGGATDPGWHTLQIIRHDGADRWFRYYAPRNLPPHPAVVFLLHGGTQSMRELFRPNAGGTQEWVTVADDEGFLLVVPNGINVNTGDPSGDHQNWNDCRGDIPNDSTADDVGFISTLIDWAVVNFSIDPERVYSTGASNGGMMSYRLAVELPDRIAAVAAFIANAPAVNECELPSTPIPVFMANGTDDRYVPWEGGSIPGGRGTVLSVDETLDQWLGANHLGPVPDEQWSYPDLDPADGCTVRGRRWIATENGGEVVMLTMEGAGHTMPSRLHHVPRWILILFGFGNQNHDIEGAREAWEFLGRQKLRP